MGSIGKDLLPNYSYVDHPLSCFRLTAMMKTILFSIREENCKRSQYYTFWSICINSVICDCK